MLGKGSVGQLSIRSSKLAPCDSPGPEEGKHEGKAEETPIDGATLRKLKVRELEGAIESSVEDTTCV